MWPQGSLELNRSQENPQAMDREQPKSRQVVSTGDISQKTLSYFIFTERSTIKIRSWALLSSLELNVTRLRHTLLSAHQLCLTRGRETEPKELRAQD
jgi:hypothetical protein